MANMTVFQTRRERTEAVRAISYILLATWDSSEITYCPSLHFFFLFLISVYPLSRSKCLSLLPNNSKKNVVSKSNQFELPREGSKLSCSTFRSCNFPQLTSKRPNLFPYPKNLLYHPYMFHSSFFPSVQTHQTRVSMDLYWEDVQLDLGKVNWELRLQKISFGGVWTSEISEGYCLLMKHII